MSKVYILLPVHNRVEITRDFIECLCQQTFSSYHLVLIDDGSSDGTAEMVQQKLPGTTVLRGNGNWWWAGSLQRGLNWIKTQSPNNDSIVLFINDDVRFAPDYLENAARVMQQKTGTLVLSRIQENNSGHILESGITANLKWLGFKIADSQDQINCLSTRGLFARWTDIQAIGSFRYRLLPHYLSDYEYTIRAFKKGMKTETSADLLLMVNTETTGYREHNEEHLSDYLRNLFSKKSANNPVYMSIFILIVMNPIWVLPNLIWLWGRVVGAIARRIIRQLARAS